MTNSKDKRTDIVVGLGEVGSGLCEVLSCNGHDPYKGITAEGHYDTMHVAFPYSPEKYDFKTEVEKYKKLFTPYLVVIHSTVPIGTSRSVGAVHSPIRGVHPHIAEGIKTFVKFFGGERANDAALIFEQHGVKTYCTESSDDTEAGKLWDTTQYGIFILLNKEIYAFCQEHHLNFEVVYTMFNATYNEGYRALGREEVVRPYLKYQPGPIGGHCVVPNAHLFESSSAERIVEENSKLRELAESILSQQKIAASVGS